MDRQDDHSRAQLCTICLEENTDCSLDSCHHQFCLPCIKKWSLKRNTCPLCRATYRVLKSDNKLIRVIPPKRSERSERMRRLRSMIMNHGLPRMPAVPHPLAIPQSMPMVQMFLPVYLIPVTLVPLSFPVSPLELSLQQGLQEVVPNSL